MVQIGSPTATVNNNWAVTGAASAHVALASVSDSSLIETAFFGQFCRVNVSSLTDPAIGTGHVIKFRAQATGSGGGGEKIQIRLYEGTTLRAQSGKITITRASFNDYTYNLSTTEANNITDYTDLRIDIEADTVDTDELLEVSEAFLEIPDAPVGGFAHSQSVIVG